ncbi:MAG: phosphoglycerate kinase [Methanoculleaceae archaeon]
MMVREYATLDDIADRSATILLRLDLNSPIDPATGIILDDSRFREHAETVRALQDSRVVVITHQSRPGKKDFTTLSVHAGLLEDVLGEPVTYIDDIFGSRAHRAVRAMEPGEILMLENLRFNSEENLNLPPEEAEKTLLVRKLAGMADLYVNDAFGTAHRSQPSMVGLPLAMPAVAGLVMDREVSALSRVLTSPPRPVTFVLGGTKVDDSLDVARHVLDNGIADRVVVVGVVGNLFLLAAGVEIGEPSRRLIETAGYTGLIDKAAELTGRYGDRVVIPSDVAVRRDGGREEVPVDAIPPDAPVLDIGSGTAEEIARLCRGSGTVVVNGPAGLFEEEEFATGTREVLTAAVEAEYSVAGGGHTSVVIRDLGLDERFSHVSTGGGACIEFLTGKTLPAVDALIRSRRKFF